MKYLSAILLSLCATKAGAEVWTYSQCVDYARLHNISLLKARLDVASAEADLDEAQGAWEPTLDFGTTQGMSYYPFGTGNRVGYNSSYGLNAAWTVWNGSRREKTIERNKLAIEASRLTADQYMRTLETDLLQAYINILYNREAIDIYASAAELSKEQAERAHALMLSGRISKVEYTQLQAQYEQDCYALVNARGTYDSRRLELKQLLELGLDADPEPQQLDWSVADVLAPLPPLDESYQLALATDLQRRALELEGKEADLDVQIARSGKSPSISLSGAVGMGYNAPGDAFGRQIRNSFGEQIGITLSIPILDNRKTRAAEARAKVTKLNAQLDLESRDTELARAVEGWYVDTRSAQANYRAALTRLESATLSASLSDEQFRLGMLNSVELRTAHDNLIDARHSLLQAKYMAMLGRKMIQFYREAAVQLP